MPSVLVPAATLAGHASDIFTAAGCAREEADAIARHLVGANLRGHDSHGVARVPRYVEWLKQGYVRAGQRIDIVSDGGAFALVDGQFGFGQTVAPQAVQLGIARAAQHGVAVIGLRNAGHIGRAGEYAEMAIEAGLVSVHFVNVAGSTLVAPFGGVERRFSTAPVAIGAPLPGRPVVLDFATSLVAEGKVMVAANGGKKLPEGALIEPDGTLSSDPRTLYGEYTATGPRNPSAGAGAIRAFGEHKGSGLAFMCEMLAGALTAGGTSGPVAQRGRIANGMLSLYLSPRAFGTEAEFHAIGLGYVEWVKACRPAEPGGEVLLPGEPEQRLAAARLAGGVPLQPDTWAGIAETAARLGVASPPLANG
jgi:uncharacterized oxidoreductase